MYELRRESQGIGRTDEIQGSVCLAHPKLREGHAIMPHEVRGGKAHRDGEANPFRKLTSSH